MNDNKDDVKLQKQREYQRIWTKKNPDRVRESARRWRQKHPEYGKKWYRKNWQKCRDKTKRWVKTHKDEINEYRKTYREENKTIITAMKHRWYQKHREEIIQKRRDYYRKNTEKCCESGSKRRQRINKQLWSILTPEEGQIPHCVLCGSTDDRYFQMHHKNGDGKEDRERFRARCGTMTIKRYYINHPDEAREKLVIMCYACHNPLGRLTYQLRKDIMMKSKAPTLY